MALHIRQFADLLEYSDFTLICEALLPEAFEVFYDCGSSVLNEMPPYRREFEGASTPSYVSWIEY